MRVSRLKTPSLKAPYAGTDGGYAFWMLVIAALFTSFYSWRLMFLTFYGKARGDKHTHEHAHESPMVMLVPLGVLQLGAIFAGAIWYGSFFGKTNEVAGFFGVPYAEASEHGEKDDHSDDHGEAKDDHAAKDDGKKKKTSYAFTGKPGEGAIYTAKDNHVLYDAHYVPTWVKLSPFIAMVIGFLLAMWFYIWDPKMPEALRWKLTVRFTTSCSTNGTLTSSMTRLSSSQPHDWALLLGSAAMEM